VIIGSGATAVTLVPAMVDDAAHVTMLQRSPTYIMPVPSKDAIANALRKVLGAKRGYAVTRRKNMLKQRAVYRMCQRYPRAARRLIRYINAKQLPAGFPVDEHFNPAYNPWDQRLCAVPNADLFKAIGDGKASVVTDHIVRFTEQGIELASGQLLEADIIVTATGLNLQAFGGIKLNIDGEPVHLPDRVAYKSMLLSGVPNFAFVFGYTNSSWTLKVGPLCEHFCKLLAHMDTHGYDTCYPEFSDPDMATRPLLDFDAGYIKRAVDQLPRQGDSGPWQMVMDFRRDVEVLRNGPVTDDNLRFATTASVPELVAAS
jgi:cation diffusion facilitator CzcD-associated flavoprotein CzcO